MKKSTGKKFEYGTDFQELILKYTVTDPQGFKVLQLYEDSYFNLIHHSVIAYALKKYYKKHKHVPEESYLREFLRVVYQTERFEDLLVADRDLVTSTITSLYSSKVAKPDIIIDKCVQFARYVAFRNEMENVDINNFDSWGASINKLRTATSIGNDLQSNYGTMLVSGMPDRAHKRDQLLETHPTPFWQMNGLLNGGGTGKGNVICFLDKEKSFKTGALINVARGFMKMRKKWFYVDLENGEVMITMRSEQSVSTQPSEIIRSGEWDDRLLKLFRKYKRIGAELAIKRFSSLKTTMDDIQGWLDTLKREMGMTFNGGCIDYGLLLGSISGKKDDFNRISDAFLDMKNFADHNQFESIWTAAHTVREAEKRRRSKYKSTDIAKCIDIPRHIDALIGLQQNEEEEEGNVLRMEIIAQRNGMKEGKMLFWQDIGHQRINEFNKKEVKQYYKELGKREDGDDEDRETKKRKRGDL